MDTLQEKTYFTTRTKLVNVNNELKEINYIHKSKIKLIPKEIKDIKNVIRKKINFMTKIQLDQTNEFIQNLFSHAQAHAGELLTGNLVQDNDPSDAHSSHL
jgi:hypothetical protein